MNNRGLAILAGVLGVLLIAAIIWGFNRNTAATELASEGEALKTENQSLVEIRDQLLGDVDSLSAAYEDLAYQNEELVGDLSTTQTELESVRSALANAKRSSAARSNDLQAQIQQLIEVRSRLENNITALQAENDSLRMRTGVLETDLARTQDERQALEELNTSMQDEVNRLTLRNFKASAFSVDLRQKNSKVTSKSGRIRTIDVAFDLTNVPERYQGVRPVYLVISDEQGNPIDIDNTISANANINGQDVPLKANQAKEVNISESQRLSFTYELQDKISAGFYRAAVFTDIGLLGASNFSVR